MAKKFFFLNGYVFVMLLNCRKDAYVNNISLFSCEAYQHVWVRQCFIGIKFVGVVLMPPFFPSKPPPPLLCLGSCGRRGAQHL